MKQYRVAIVEDDKDYSEFLSQCLGKYGLEKEISFSIKTYGKAESFLDDYKKACDVVFMDVELGDGFLNGMEAARVEFYSDSDRTILRENRFLIITIKYTGTEISVLLVIIQSYIAA